MDHPGAPRLHLDRPAFGVECHGVFHNDGGLLIALELPIGGAVQQRLAVEDLSGVALGQARLNKIFQ